uniref:(California timema) hypothetical protein n=1 Tax=Timema californicum TaxID=61474 RepID=A0A7R9PEB3_TIMCA|nr:unnamed protein product [Timema californicum]
MLESIVILILLSGAFQHLSLAVDMDQEQLPQEKCKSMGPSPLIYQGRICDGLAVSDRELSDREVNNGPGHGTTSG